MRGFMPFDERAFDFNDWFLLSGIAVFYGLVYILPKRFSRAVTLLLFMFSSTIASILDNSISGHLFDLYDIMDGPAYSIMDFVVYFLYAPFGYFFIYIYDRFGFRDAKTAGYIVLFSIFSVMFEWLSARAGLFYYKHGYGIAYSFCIYLVVQSCTVLFYHFIADKPADPVPKGTT